MPHYVLTIAQQQAVETILNSAIQFSAPGVVGGLLNGTAYVGMAVDFSAEFSPVSTETVPAFTAGPTITGDPLDGQTLTLTQTLTGTEPITLERRWLIDAGVVSGATGATWTAAGLDVGEVVTAQVRATNSQGNTGWVSSNGLTVEPVLIAPSVTTGASASEVDNGETITYTFTPPVVAGNPTPTVTRVLTLAGATVTGAMVGNAYTVSKTNSTRALVMTYTAANGTAPNATSVVNRTVPALVLPANTALPIISGAPAVGQTLTGSTGTWTGTPTITYARQWRRNGVAISGATGATYVLVADDTGANITLAVVATNAAGSSAPVVSASVGPVTATAGAVFLNDTFSGETAQVDLNEHVSDSGHTWARHPSASTRVMRVTPAGTVYLLTANPDVIYFASAVPPSADIEVTASVVNFTLVSDNQHSIALRVSETQVTGYFAVINMRANGERVITLNRRLNGVTTAIGESALITDWQVDVPKELKLRAVGGQITVLLDGVVVIAVTDNQVTAAGRIAIGGRQSSAPSASTGSLGVHLRSISAETYAAPVVEPPPADITFTQSSITEGAPVGTEAGSFA